MIIIIQDYHLIITHHNSIQYNPAPEVLKTQKSSWQAGKSNIGHNQNEGTKNRVARSDVFLDKLLY